MDRRLLDCGWRVWSNALRAQAMVNGAPMGVTACCLHVQFAISVCRCAQALPLSAVWVRCRLQCSRRGPRPARFRRQSCRGLPGDCGLHESPRGGCVGQSRTRRTRLKSLASAEAQGARCWPSFGAAWWDALLVVLVVVVVVVDAGRRQRQRQDQGSQRPCACGRPMAGSGLVRRVLPGRVAAGHRQNPRAAGSCGARCRAFRALPA